MIRIFKGLGPTLAAVCALGVVASGASAAEFTSFNTTTSLHEGGTYTGTDLEEPSFTVAPEALQIKCSSNTYKGSSATGTEPTPRVQPIYGACAAYLFGGKVGSPVINNTGCEDQYHIAGGAGDSYTGTRSIVCPAGVSGIDITTSNGCTILLAASNTAINGITYTNNTATKPTDVVFDVASTNIKTTTSGGFFACGISDGEHTTGTWNAKLTMKALNSKGEQTDLTVM